MATKLVIKPRMVRKTVTDSVMDKGVEKEVEKQVDVERVTAEKETMTAKQMSDHLATMPTENDLKGQAAQEVVAQLRQAAIERLADAEIAADVVAVNAMIADGSKKVADILSYEKTK